MAGPSKTLTSTKTITTPPVVTPQTSTQPMCILVEGSPFKAIQPSDTVFLSEPSGLITPACAYSAESLNNTTTPTPKKPKKIEIKPKQIQNSALGFSGVVIARSQNGQSVVVFAHDTKPKPGDDLKLKPIGSILGTTGFKRIHFCKYDESTKQCVSIIRPKLEDTEAITKIPASAHNISGIQADLVMFQRSSGDVVVGYFETTSKFIVLTEHYKFNVGVDYKERNKTCEAPDALSAQKRACSGYEIEGTQYVQMNGTHYLLIATRGDVFGFELYLQAFNMNYNASKKKLSFTTPKEKPQTISVRIDVPKEFEQEAKDFYNQHISFFLKTYQQIGAKIPADSKLSKEQQDIYQTMLNAFIATIEENLAMIDGADLSNADPNSPKTLIEKRNKFLKGILITVPKLDDFNGQYRTQMLAHLIRLNFRASGDFVKIGHHCYFSSNLDLGDKGPFFSFVHEIPASLIDELLKNPKTNGEPIVIQNRQSKLVASLPGHKVEAMTGFKDKDGNTHLLLCTDDEKAAGGGVCIPVPTPISNAPFMNQSRSDGAKLTQVNK